MKSICSSTKAFQASNAWCLTSTARTMTILFLPYNRQVWNAVEMVFAKQVHREKSWIWGGFAGASYRWHRCFWYAVYWGGWEVPTAWFLWGICGWCEMKTFISEMKTFIVLQFYNNYYYLCHYYKLIKILFLWQCSLLLLLLHLLFFLLMQELAAAIEVVMQN